jgi:hypothetical protein
LRVRKSQWTVDSACMAAAMQVSAKGPRAACSKLTKRKKRVCGANESSRG